MRIFEKNFLKLEIKAVTSQREHCPLPFLGMVV